MRTPEQVKWDFVQQWLDKASNDLRAASVLLEADLADYENVGFHAQQAAEKLLKAYLVRHQIEFSKTHNIAVLRQLVGKLDQALADRLKGADALTPYGVEFRYPGDLAEVTHDEGKEAVRLAGVVRDAVVEALRSYLDVGRPAGEPDSKA